jgi:hypothetical protein
MISVVVALAVVIAVVPARHAYAWPEPIEGFITAMQTGDAPAALAVLSEDAVVSLPYELAPPGSTLVPAGPRPINGTLTLTGPAQIGAWLAEFMGRDNGRLYIQGPARGRGNLITVKATVRADSLREVFASWPVGSLDITLQGEKLTSVALTLAPETLAALRLANPQIYAVPHPLRTNDPARPRPD